MTKIRPRRNHSTGFKAKVALAAIRGDKTLNELPVSRQCRLLGLSRSGCYYTPRPISERDLDLMRKIDEHHISYPSYGSRRIQDGLLDLGLAVGRDHVRSLMCRMGFEAVYQKPRLSQPHPAHKAYPHLLRSLSITRANHVWATDITHIPMPRGFAYKPSVTVQTTPTTSLGKIVDDQKTQREREINMAEMIIRLGVDSVIRGFHRSVLASKQSSGYTSLQITVKEPL